MASCSTSRWVSTAPYVKLTVTESSSTATSSTLSWTLQYISEYAASTSVNKVYKVTLGGATVKEGTFNINGKTGTHTIASGTKTINKTTSNQSIAFNVSFTFNLTWSGTYGGTKSASGSISVAKKTSYTVKYNANGGTGAPSAQTKWYGTALTLSSTKPTRSGYAFQGWATSASGSVAYAAGASYTTDASVTLYAVWKSNSFTVKYNANGGSGAPASQTKAFNVPLTLSSTIPTRSGYTFKGWGTAASATTVVYAAGATYNANASVTLFAIWSSSYSRPKITSVSASRCDSSGTVSDSGTYLLVKFNWSTSYTVSSITVGYKLGSATDYTNTSVSASRTSGSVSQILGGGAISIESTYDIQITVMDSNGSSGGATRVTTHVNSQCFPIDFLKGGTGVAIGKAAEKSNTFDVAWQTNFDKMIYSKYTDIALRHQHGTSGVMVGVGVGSGGINRGVYDYQLQRWLLRGDGTDTYLNCSIGEVRPYYKPGDSFEVYIQTAGFVTNSGKDVWFTVPLIKQTLGVSAVTAVTVNGFVLRQNNAYTHGGAASTVVSPSSYQAYLRPHGAVSVKATFSATTNVVNNAPIGIDAYIKLTFS